MLPKCLLASYYQLFILAMFLCVTFFYPLKECKAQFRSTYSNLPTTRKYGSQRTPARRGGFQRQQKQGPKGVYPQFKTKDGRVVRWLKEQMPLKIWVSNGEAIDSIINPKLGAPYINSEHTDIWPDVVANLIESKGKLQSLPKTNGYYPQHRKAAIEGFNSWKPLEKQGYFSYEFTDDPMEADIHVFFINHFVNRLGLALMAHDIRGMTAKRSFSYKAIMKGGKAHFKPVVVVLRVIDKFGKPMSLPKMKASAAHEMGHCLGIEEHSLNPYDLMHVNYGRGVISPNDAATVKYLYKITPDLIP